ncbi:MAG: hypothetical protein JOZ73_01110, partial [Solirubrobacterales bacterium]|nr:hypothetical protein [Solirubrobacterales bacterium]
MDRDLQRRIAANEAVFRELNEGIARGQWPGEEQESVGFRCECARLGCNTVIELTLPAYQDVRAHSRRFVIAVGHELPGAERVVQSSPGYSVVEKCDEAGELA